MSVLLERFRSCAARAHNLSLAVSIVSIFGLMAGDALSQEYKYKCEEIEQKSVLSSFGSQVYQGYDGWFFRRYELKSMFEMPDSVVSMFANVNRALASKGTHLILLPMLPKGMAAYDFLPKDGVLADMIFDVRLAREDYRRMTSVLNDVGLDVVNLEEALREDPSFDRNSYYFKRDLHWQPAGARFAANKVAERIESCVSDAMGNVEYTTSGPVEGRLVSSLNLVLNELCQSPVPTEPIELYETKQVVSSLDDLLTEEPVTDTAFLHVVGSSFTDEAKPFAFNDFLRARLRRVVDGFSIAGGGVDQSIYAWAQKSEGLGRKPRFVVWELPNLADLIKLAPEMNRTIVPAIVGSCENEYLIANQKFESSSQIDFDFPDLSGDPGSYYMEFNFSNRALTEFNFSYEYPGQVVENVNYRNPPRVTGLMKLYQALPGGRIESPLKVIVDLGANTTSAGSVSLCRYPAGIVELNVQN